MTDADKRQAMQTIIKTANELSLRLDNAIAGALNALASDASTNEAIGWLSGADTEAKRIAAMLETVNIMHATRQKKD